MPSRCRKSGSTSEGKSEWIKGREYVWQTVPSADAKFIASLVDNPPDYSKLKIPTAP